MAWKPRISVRDARLGSAVVEVAWGGVKWLVRQGVVATTVGLAMAGAAYWGLDGRTPGMDHFMGVAAAGTGAAVFVLLLFGKVAGKLREAWRQAWSRWRTYPAMRRSLGRHEAGHGLLGLALGLPYRKIELDDGRQGGDNGHAFLKPPLGWPGGGDALETAAKMILALEAGKAAQTLDEGWTDDQRKAAELDSLLQISAGWSMEGEAPRAVRGLFAEARWRAALDAVAVKVAEEGQVLQADLERVVIAHGLRDGIEEWFAAVVAASKARIRV